MRLRHEQVYELVRRVPEGRVATYGQIAELAGFPRHARQVGYALAALKGHEGDVPWHRVVNAAGRISSRFDAGSEDYQRLLLEEEGVAFNARGRIDLRRYRWQP